MRFKIDENLHDDVAALLVDAGHDVHTVLTKDCAAPVTRQLPSIAEMKTEH